MLDDLDFDQLLIGAAESPPSSRIEFRDPIARHGVPAVEAMLPWLIDRQLAAFAVRVIRKAADFGAKQEAIAALRASLLLLQEPYLGDARSALAELGARDAAPRVRVARAPTVGSIASTNELVIGKVYRRKDLHDSGLGGNRQKGISYGADATEVLLFSDPASDEKWGYRDSWQGSDAYRYYGEWSGTGDMTFTGWQSSHRRSLARTPPVHQGPGWTHLCGSVLLQGDGACPWVPRRQAVDGDRFRTWFGLRARATPRRTRPARPRRSIARGPGPRS